MDNQIDQVIAELSKIDDAAARVLSNSEADKEAYATEIKQKIKDFDEKLDETTKKELAEFEAKLQADKDAELARSRVETMQTLSKMDEWFENNHTALANQIVNDLTKE